MSEGQGFVLHPLAAQDITESPCAIELHLSKATQMQAAATPVRTPA
jgi:hypothetical protein